MEGKGVVGRVMMGGGDGLNKEKRGGGRMEETGRGQLAQNE